jgi:hypothetical protein
MTTHTDNVKLAETNPAARNALIEHTIRARDVMASNLGPEDKFDKVFRDIAYPVAQLGFVVEWNDPDAGWLEATLAYVKALLVLANSVNTDRIFQSIH